QQVKVSKRVSRRVDAQLAYAWQNELTNGGKSNTSYGTASAPLLNGVVNKGLNKQSSGFSLPQTLTLSCSYTTPKLRSDAKAFQALSWAVRDWTIGGGLHYASGQILATPSSSANLLDNLARGNANNPAVWGGGWTFMNRV